MKIVTCIAPVNIAVIKYWGKLNDDLIIPLNDSLSASFSTDIMCAKTTVFTSPSLKESKFWLNGKEQPLDSARFHICLNEIKKRANKSLSYLNWHIAICSENNFPTAAGLASSAAGYACLVSALAKLYEVEGDLSSIARMGSGSACRSMYGGWVQWHKGSLPDGSDSISRQVAPPSHWQEMRILILVTNELAKKHNSTQGMRRSVQTSRLLDHRAKVVAPENIERIKMAILEKDFHTFAEVTMKDSNSMHAVMLDSYPPMFYMSETSHIIIDLVHAYNELKKTNKVAYTFDAGPNGCIYLLESEVEEFMTVVNYVFPPPSDTKEYYRGIPLELKNVSEEIKEKLGISPQPSGSLKYVIYTKIGEGPQLLTDNNEHLLMESGIPKKF